MIFMSGENICKKIDEKFGKIEQMLEKIVLEHKLHEETVIREEMSFVRDSLREVLRTSLKQHQRVFDTSVFFTGTLFGISVSTLVWLLVYVFCLQ